MVQLKSQKFKSLYEATVATIYQSVMIQALTWAVGAWRPTTDQSACTRGVQAKARVREPRIRDATNQTGPGLGS